MEKGFKGILKKIQTEYTIFEYATIIFFLAAALFYFLGFDANWKLIMMVGFVILVIDFVQLGKKRRKLKETVSHMSKKDKEKLIKIEQEVLKRKK